MPAMARRTDGQRGRHKRHGRRIETRHRADSAHGGHEQRSAAHADAAAHQGEKRAFQKKLHQDAAIGRAQRFAQADLAGALADRDQHDVDDADRAQGKVTSPTPPRNMSMASKILPTVSEFLIVSQSSKASSSCQSKP